MATRPSQPGWNDPPVFDGVGRQRQVAPTKLNKRVLGYSWGSSGGQAGPVTTTNANNGNYLPGITPLPPPPATIQLIPTFPTPPLQLDVNKNVQSQEESIKDLVVEKSQ